MPPTADYLGKFNGGLKLGDHIVEFAPAGPKNYGYRTHDGKVGRNVSGFTLNTRGQAQLNFDLSYWANVIHEVTELLEEPHTIPLHNPHMIKQNTDTKTVEETKR